MKLLHVLLLTRLLSCDSNVAPNSLHLIASQVKQADEKFISDSCSYGSWKYFLQHLPTSDGPVLDYTGAPIPNQGKHAAIISYDIGARDLQQCADALIRLRAEYLFARKRFDEIGFHFCSGLYYTWNAYNNGYRPVVKSNTVHIAAMQHPSERSHASLRRYLEIVYTYANTVSLCRELLPAENFETGTVIITPGYPGHTCMIVDEATTPAGEKVFKLAEGYMPAQSIYVLRNPSAQGLSPWYRLKPGEIRTSSYVFRQYLLRKFE